MRLSDCVDDLVPDFSNTRLVDVVGWLEERRSADGATFRVLDPDATRGSYPGERVDIDGAVAIHRPLRVWIDLAERMRLRLRTPRAVADSPLLELTFEPLDESARPWTARESAAERYGASSAFQRISRLDDPYFVLDLRDAVERVGLGPGARILDLGVNAGEEVQLLDRLGVPQDAQWVGIDHSRSAIEAARARLSAARFTFIEADINHLDAIEPGLGRFDLIVSLGTLQSPGVDDREVFRKLVQQHLQPHGSVILGFPNGQFVDGEPLYGARTVNITQPELSLLVKTVAFYKKYLQQHHKRVFITGKDDVFVTGVGRRQEP